MDGYHQGRADEFFAGSQRQLPGQTTVDVGVLRRVYRQRPATVEVNGVYEGRMFKGYRDVTQNDIYRLTANT